MTSPHHTLKDMHTVVVTAMLHRITSHEHPCSPAYRTAKWSALATASHEHRRQLARTTTHAVPVLSPQLKSSEPAVAVKLAASATLLGTRPPASWRAGNLIQLMNMVKKLHGGKGQCECDRCSRQNHAELPIMCAYGLSQAALLGCTCT